MATGRGDAASVLFGRQVAARRSALGLSQSELAVRTETRRSTIARVENGQGPADAVLFHRLADALGTEGGRAGAWENETPLPTETSRDRPRPTRSDPARRRAGFGLAAAIAAASVVMVAVGLIIDAPRVSDGFEGIKAAIDAPGVEALDSEAPPSAAPDSVAFGDWQTVGAVDAPGRAGTLLSAHAGTCALGFTQARFLAYRILYGQSPVGLAVRYPVRACDPVSRLTIAWLRPSQGGYDDSQETPIRNQGSSQGGGQGGSQGAGDPVGNTINNPGSGAGSTVGNTGSTVGNTVKKPVSGVGSTVGNTVNNVGNTVNNVGDAVNPAGGVGGIVKGLGE